MMATKEEDIVFVSDTDNAAATVECRRARFYPPRNQIEALLHRRRLLLLLLLSEI